MRVLFVSSQFPNPAEPNRGIFSLQIVKELAGLAEVRVVAPVPSLGLLKVLDSFKRYRTDFFIPDQEVVDGITVYHPKYFAPPGMGFLHPVTLRRTLQPLLEKIHEQWQIDAVNCHWVFPDGVAMQRICEELKLPVLLTPLGTDLNRFGEFRLRKGAIRRALVRADKVSVLSSPMYQRCAAMGVGAARLSIIPNGVDLQKFSLRDRSQCRGELRIPEGAQVILFVGALVPVKGIETLLHAFALLRERRRAVETRLYIVGQGFLEQELRRLAGELQLGATVVFQGAVVHHELPVWMNCADCLCLPSLSEGHPNVVMEALACGVPVVASTVGSVPDYVDERNGGLVEPGDQVGLAEKLEQCLSARYAREAIRGAVEDMSWSSCAEKYHAALNSLLPSPQVSMKTEAGSCMFS